MLMDLPKQMRRIIQFLELDVSEKTFNRVLEDASFGSMQKDPKANFSTFKDLNLGISKFFRSGKVGQWKKYFTVAQNEWFDEMYMDRLKNTGLEIQFE